MRESFAKGRAEMEQPGGLFFDQFVPACTAQPPYRGLFDCNDRCGARLARQERHFAEPILWTKNRDVFFAATGAFEHHLNGSGLNKVKRVSLISLRENSGRGGKKI